MRGASLLAALGAVLAAAPLSAQGVLDRSPNLQGDWGLARGSALFVTNHRFEVLQGGDELFSVPTLTLAAGLPFALVAGVDFTTFGEVAPDRLAGNEAQLWLKRRLAAWGGGGGGLSGLVGWNTAAESVDGALNGRHTLAGRLGLFAELRAFSSLFGSGDAAAAGAVGASLRLTPHLALTGDVGRVFSPDTVGTVWSGALALELPGTPHTLSLQAANAGAVTLQGASQPKVVGPESVRWGFAFTAPLSPGRIADVFRSGPALAPPAAGVAVRVQMRQFAFAPAEVRIRAGETVEWINLDAAAHTVTADDGSWGSPLFGQGETFTRTFTAPGRYPYYCAPHPQMRGVVVVQ